MSNIPTKTIDPVLMEHDACGIGAVINIGGTASHSTVDNALKIVEKLEHRAGKDAAGETGDGVGILLQIPHRLMVKAAAEIGIEDLGGARDYGVGMFFFPSDRLRRLQAQKMLQIIVERNGMEFLGWRSVPTHPEVLGARALESMPVIMQCFVRRPEGCARGLEFDRKLYLVRREFEQSDIGTYIPSFSSRTIVYKGMFLVHQLRQFYDDLMDPLCESALATVHSRFSTNTNPSWERAHPNRYIMHNGEINTIRGNVDRMMAREESMHSPVLTDEEMDRVLPVVDGTGSDSSMLDNTLEFLMMNGIELPQAVMMLIPEPWANNTHMEEKRDFYQYYATMMEAWDGPAAVVFSDGDIVGAVLDRNGLRPCRWYTTDDGNLILASEVGVLETAPEHVTRKSRLQPGKMLLVDTVKKQIIEDEELKLRYARQSPYGEWLDMHLVHLKDLPIPNMRVEKYTQPERDRLYKAFGYTYEEIKDQILPMARDGAEPIASMGTDIPLAVLSEARQPLFNYFKQLFAQVTNPPIDAIREEIVTDTAVYLGSSGNLLMEKAENCAVLQIQNPILTSVDLMKIRHMKNPEFKVETISLLYYKRTPLEQAVERLFVACDRAYANGANILILSDRGVDENHLAIPSLLALSSVEQHLVRTKKRTAVSMIMETAEPRTVHHFATLLGYGAQAVNPYLAQECIEEMISLNMLDKDPVAAIDDYNHAILHGIVKIASKMGVSTIQSYQSAQIFEIVGISRKVVDRYFSNTVSRIEGVGLEEIGEGVEWKHDQAFDPLRLGIDIATDSVGSHKLRSGKDVEDHLYSPLTIKLLQKAAREGSYEVFLQYAEQVDRAELPHTLRGLLDLRYDPGGGIPIDEVEPVDSIVRRFKTGAMSYGSISLEAHECLALAMNELGGKSNSGEGGETPERLKDPSRCSAIKQIASGRFGVTSEYLNSAKELQIKMAQGAKPGEGGHLPGSKVYPWIAKTRYSTPGVSLVSPPPHHDIYSIEDLAQLIFDLKNANRNARISVKLVSEAGVGTIACGVAKAGAQVVLVSGYDGGTGAAPESSIHSAGLPWELGVAEAHRTLIENGLRSQVVLETDGKLMTGRDVAIACMLGAEEFGFATAPLVTLGCCMMRVCNLDTCPVGVATQNPELRKRFAGKPEYVMNFMRFVAQELREHMAKLGIATVDELVGRSDLLYIREKLNTHRAETVALDTVLNNPCGDHVPHFDPSDLYDFHLEQTKDMSVLLRKLGPSLKRSRHGAISLEVSSTDRAFGTLFGSEITRACGTDLPEDSYVISCSGGGGQSFGAFIPHGLTIRLSGDSNDGFGKGLSGGKLVLVPPEKSPFKAEENIIVGNVALYGATSGKAFINGIAGERFCVRNSGAVAVVEGVGDHGCEYMTGGRAVVLGPTGKNFAAGMSGGIVYVLDDRHDLYTRLNKTGLEMSVLSEANDIQELKNLIEEHVKNTGSEKGSRILADFDHYIPSFKKIIPVDYAKMIQSIGYFEGTGQSREQAEISAFYAAVNH